MKSIFSILISLFIGIVLVGCGQKELPSHNTLESQRAVALENALFNAKGYRAINPRYDESYKLVQHTDTAISEECPQGSGWAELSLMKVEGKDVDKVVLKCSTYSGSLGCYRDEEFTKKPFAAEFDVCQKVGKLPYPLQKIAK